MIRARHALALVLTTGLVITGGAAQAGTKSVKDQSTDAPATADITRVKVNNAADTLVIKVKLRKASAGRTHLVATLIPAAAESPTYVVRTVVADGNAKGKGKKIGATLESFAPDAVEGEVVECPGLKASVSSGRNGQSTLRVPQGCFGEDAGTLVVEVATVTPEDEVLDEGRPLRVKKAKR